METTNYENKVNQAVKEAMANISFEENIVLTTSEKQKITKEIVEDGETKSIVLKKGKCNGKRYME